MLSPIPKRHTHQIHHFVVNLGGVEMFFQTGIVTTACHRVWVISVVVKQAVMGRARLFCSGAGPADLWITPTLSADGSHHYALDGGELWMCLEEIENAFPVCCQSADTPQAGVGVWGGSRVYYVQEHAFTCIM